MSDVQSSKESKGVNEEACGMEIIEHDGSQKWEVDGWGAPGKDFVGSGALYESYRLQVR